MSFRKVPLRVLTAIALILRIASGRVVIIFTSVLLSGAFQHAVSFVVWVLKEHTSQVLHFRTDTRTQYFDILHSGQLGAPCVLVGWAAVDKCNGSLCSVLVPFREARRKKEVLSLGYHGNVVDLW